jgi:imidazolonepropionase-like amidohydrolase
VAAPGVLGAQETRTPLALTNVVVVDVTGARAPMPRTTVLVEGNRITAIGRDGLVRLPARTRRVDGGGRYLVPGLWDMHVHTAAVTLIPEHEFAANAPYAYPLLIAHGVTGIRDMSGNLEMLVRWRDSIAQGRMLGPRMVVTGRKLGSNLPVVPGAPHPVRTAADVRRSVRMLRERGADFVKLEGLPEPLYHALFDAARDEGLRVTGHVPPWIGLREVAGGMWTAEHLQGVFLDASTRRRELLAHEQRAWTLWGRALIRFRLWDLAATRLQDQRLAVETWSDSAAAELAARLRTTRTWVTPTLIGLRDIAATEPRPARADQAAYHLPLHDRARAEAGPGEADLIRRRLDLYYHAAGLLSREGVSILAGSDAPGTSRVYGFSLVEELEQLVAAGLTPLQALQAATLNAARALRASDSLGTIETGHIADLVLVDRNPLDAISNLRAVHAVVVNGRFLPRAELDGMLEGVRAYVRHARAELDSLRAARAATRN